MLTGLNEKESKIKDILKEVIDPEVEVNIVDLGLIYEIKSKEGVSSIIMTLSTPACPLGDVIILNVEESIKKEYPEEEVHVELVFDPPWTPEMVSPEGKRLLS